MENIKELYILGEPIDTPIGQCHFIKVKDYHKLIKYIPYLNLEKYELISYFRKHSEALANYLEEQQFIDIIKASKEYTEVYKMFQKLFQLCFKEDVFDLIETDDEFEYYRQLIRDMNCITYEKPNPNPEIAFFDKLDRIVKERRGEVVTFESLVTSVGLYIPTVLQLTIYQLHKYFERISYFYSYNTTSMYRIVTNEINVIPWYSSNIENKTELTEEDKNYLNSNINKIKGGNINGQSTT